MRLPAAQAGAGGGGQGDLVPVFVRPHELELAAAGEGGEGVPARVVRVHSAGPSVRLELLTDAGEPALAEVSHERCRALGLAREARVLLRPREARVFEAPAA